MSIRSERIKQLIEESGKSYIELEKITGIKKSSLQRYASGTTKKIPLDVIEILSNVFNVPQEYLMGWDESSRPHPNLQLFAEYLPQNARPTKTKKLPMLGNVACGEPMYASESYDAYIDVGSDIDADFCLTAKGDSMINARIFDGDILFVKSQPTVENGEIAVVLIEDEATVKRVYYDRENNIVTLVPENPTYKPMRYSGTQLNQIRIIGKVILGQYKCE